MQLARLFRREGRAHDPTRPWTGPADATPVHGMLDQRGVPWRLNRGDLVDRYGIETDETFQRPVVRIAEPRPFLPGLVAPLSVQVGPELSPRVPATEYFAVAWFSDDARENVRRSADEVAQHLGRGRIANVQNAIEAQWRFGAASITLRGWPAERNRAPLTENAVHTREPRIARGCHIHVMTGWRPPLSPTERGWLETFASLGPTDPEPGVTPQALRDRPVAESLVEHARPIPDEFAPLIGQLGRSADGEALIACRDQLFVVPADEVAGFRLVRLRPARGSGGSWLEVLLHTHVPDAPTKPMLLASLSSPEGLEPIAETLARAFDRPLDMPEPGRDD